MIVFRLSGSIAAAGVLAGPALAAPSPAYNYEPAPNIWYASLHGGAVWADEMEFLSFGDIFVTDMSTGWAGGGALGYRYESGFRGEIEATWRNNEGDIFEFGVPGVESAKISSLSIMLNGLYDFDMGGSFTPYIGGGIGTARVDFELFDAPVLEDDGWAFAYQFIGGFSFPMPNTQIEVFADYRYLRTAELEVFPSEVQDHDEYVTHSVTGGFRFNF